MEDSLSQKYHKTIHVCWMDRKNAPVGYFHYSVYYFITQPTGV